MMLLILVEKMAAFGQGAKIKERKKTTQMVITTLILPLIRKTQPLIKATMNQQGIYKYNSSWDKRCGCQQ